MNKAQNNGFILVASVRYVYYKSAIICAETLRDHYPDANITLFTHDEWVDNDAVDLFDNIVTDIPINKRSKIWALSRSPYDTTMYLDADMQVSDPEISRCFDLISDTDIDILMTKTRSYAAAITTFPGGELTWHCGLLLYQKNDRTSKLFDAWYEEYNRQNEEWPYDESLYPRSLRQWDTWTFWKLMNLDGYDKTVNVSRFPEDARWNFHNLSYDELNERPVIIYHNTIRSSHEHERNITE